MNEQWLALMVPNAEFYFHFELLSEALINDANAAEELLISILNFNS